MVSRYIGQSLRGLWQETIDEKLETLSDQWERVQSKRRRGKKELFKKAMKKRMELILKSFRNCNGVAVHWAESTRSMASVLRDRERRKRWRIDSLTWTS